MRLAGLWLLLLTAATAQQTDLPAGMIDSQRSTLTIHAGSSGLFSAFGHDHTVRAPIRDGRVLLEPKPQVELMVDARAMQVLDPDLSEKDRAQVQRDMHAKVLESERFPEIKFRSTQIQRQGDGWRVTGELTLHGQSQPVAVSVKRQARTYIGESKFKQTAFGIKPISVAGGTVKVKDELKIEFVIHLEGAGRFTVDGYTTDERLSR